MVHMRMSACVCASACVRVSETHLPFACAFFSYKFFFRVHTDLEVEVENLG